jgi:ABC-2 type transport system ATP-binding protein
VGEDDRLEFTIGDQPLAETLAAEIQQSVDGVAQVRLTQPEAAGDRLSPGRITVFAKRGRRALPDVINFLNRAGVAVQAVEVREPDLEAVFLALTGRALRD